MKKNRKQDQAFLYEQINKAGDLGFDYADIKNRVNVLPYEQESAPQAPRYRLRPQALAVACSLLLVTAAVSFGGFMMSRRGAVTEPDTTVSGETVHDPEGQSPHKLPALFPDDVLLWQGDVYIRTDLTVKEDAVGDQLGQVVSEGAPGSQQNIRDNPQAAIAEHLEDGTPFHQVTDDENYIAVFSEDNYVIYQRQFTPGTTTP